VTVIANQHVGIRVASISRAGVFYEQVFDARFVVRPFIVAEEFARVVMEGPEGVAFRCAMLAIGGSHLELFEFIDPAWPTEPIHPTRGNLLHLAIQVDDVDEAVRRVEGAGGSRVWPDVNTWGTSHAIYVRDPDHNTIELLDVSFVEMARITLDVFPECDPRGSTE
jgi:catechol 2,3-dioxygenase-like lactoylglutathione lyase family enzyme